MIMYVHMLFRGFGIDFSMLNNFLQISMFKDNIFSETIPLVRLNGYKFGPLEKGEGWSRLLSAGKSCVFSPQALGTRHLQPTMGHQSRTKPSQTFTPQQKTPKKINNKSTHLRR